MSKPKQIKRRRGRPKKVAWKPMWPGMPIDAPDELVRTNETWVNDIYQVFVYNWESPPGYPPLVNLSIKRNDRKPIHDWRDMYRIKSELCGTGCWAVEVFPSQDHLVDTANQYHMYVFAPGFVYPLHLKQMAVTDYSDAWKEILAKANDALGKSADRVLGKAKQRKWEPHHKCDDLPLVGPVWEKRGFSVLDGKITFPPEVLEAIRLAEHVREHGPVAEEETVEQD